MTGMTVVFTGFLSLTGIVTGSTDAAAVKAAKTVEEVLAQQSGDISVCTEAVKLNLVSSGGVRPISLTAPTGARMTLVETNRTPESSETHTITAAATGGQGD